MSVTTKRYIRKAIYVDAVRITLANFDEIAAWCQGEVLQDEVPGKGATAKYIKIRVHNPKNPRQTKAFVGDWLLYAERGYKVYTNKAFHSSFDEVGKEEKPVAYPYDDGDVTVLGPECFVSRDGGVLCWKGVNYVPQGSGTSITLMGGEVVDIDDETVEGSRDAEALEEQRGEGIARNTEKAT